MCLELEVRAVAEAVHCGAFGPKDRARDVQVQVDVINTRLKQAWGQK